MKTYEHTQFFPQEAFDCESDDRDDVDERQYDKNVVHITRTLRAASREILDAFDGVWDKTHELELADTIQAGLRAQRDRDEAGDAYDGCFDDVINKGERARYELVVANLPYAAYLARASMGKRTIPETHTDGVPAVPRSDDEYMGRLKEVGTFSRISGLANPGASLEDRTQVAMEAMWFAANKYRNNTEDGKPSAKFLTYASWWIQHALHNHVMTEVSGWDAARSVFDQYMKALEAERLYGTPPSIRHAVEGRGKHEGLHPVQMLEGRLATSYDSVKFDDHGESDVFGEPSSLDLADVVIDPAPSAHEKAVESNLRALLMEVLDTLSEREAGVITMRFGLDDGEPKTLNEIGKVYGVSRERVRQLESKTMSKLRNPDRSQVLNDFVFLPDDTEDSSKTALPLADGTSHVKSYPVAARGGKMYGLPESKKEDESLPHERDPNLESWQASAEDVWDEPVRKNRLISALSLRSKKRRSK